ncbi:sensor histidine kinase [Nocardioides sp. J2M5]|uniref:sensor histidine kinase n=1 Tax=Nocardioides palaemonis TaxID=2829810 RepID=UPI001BAC07EB|nr:histidine kinase [Nocardioides palaemonis]MBS2937327.1 sensor histidine kinase [Nocardioides palaemonis]
MPPFLRQLWHLPAAPGARGRTQVDVGLVVYFAVHGILETVVGPDDRAWRWVALATFLVWLPTLLVRRTHTLVPITVFSAMAVVQLAVGVASGRQPADLTAGVAALMIPFALARWARGRDAVVGIGLFAAVAGIALVTQTTSTGDRVGGLAVVVASVALGAVFRSRAVLQVRELGDVRRDERERLARDLHDTVAHHLTAIAISAQAGLAVADTDPEAAKRALRRIDEEASRTLAETRTVVRALREEGDVPERPLDDLAGLAGAGDGGPAVDVRLDDVDGLSPTTAAALHRIAQEAVSNARRHALDPTRVDVRVVRRGTDVELTVHDDGRGRPPQGAGFGIVGMTERAALLGGTLVAGPATGGGWTVRAVLPERAEDAW